MPAPIKIQMSIPDAMRAGAYAVPQIYGEFYDTNESFERDDDLVITGVCAMGAVGLAMDGAELNYERSVLADFADSAFHYGEFDGVFPPCPAHGEPMPAYTELPKCSWHPSVLNELIAHLNDSHRWTIQQIADWLDTIPAVATKMVEVIVAYELDQPVIEPWQDVVARIPDYTTKAVRIDGAH